MNKKNKTLDELKDELIELQNKANDKLEQKIRELEQRPSNVNISRSKVRIDNATKAEKLEYFEKQMHEKYGMEHETYEDFLHRITQPKHFKGKR